MLAGIWNATTPLIVLPLAVLVVPHRAADRAQRGRAAGWASSACWWCSGVWEGVGGAHFTGQLMCFGAAACYGVAIPYQKRFIAGSAALRAWRCRRRSCCWPPPQLAVVAPLVAGRAAGADRRCRPRCVGERAGAGRARHRARVRDQLAQSSGSPARPPPSIGDLPGADLRRADRRAGARRAAHWHQPVGALIVLVGVAVSQGCSAGAAAAGGHRPGGGRAATAASTRPARAGDRARRRLISAGPSHQAVGRPGVDHPVGGDAAQRRPLAAVVAASRAGRGRARRCRSRTGSRPRSATPEQPLRRVQPLRPGVDLDGLVVLGAGGEDRVGVELALRPGPPPGAPGRPARSPRPGGRTLRPVQWPRMSRCGLAIAAQHPPGHPRRVVLQPAVHRADHHVEPGQQLVVLVQRAVGEDVHLDAGEDAGSPSGSAALSAATTSSCSAQPLGGRARGPRSAGASGRSAPGTRGPARPRRAPSPRSASRRRTSRSGCGSRRAAPRAARRPPRPGRCPRWRRSRRR